MELTQLKTHSIQTYIIMLQQFKLTQNPTYNNHIDHTCSGGPTSTLSFVKIITKCLEKKIIPPPPHLSLYNSLLLLKKVVGLKIK